MGVAVGVLVGSGVFVGVGGGGVFVAVGGRGVWVGVSVGNCVALGSAAARVGSGSGIQPLVITSSRDSNAEMKITLRLINFNTYLHTNRLGKL